jgi:glucosamine-6-phosphate deaminase
VKVSFSTLACPSWTLHEVISTAARLGYDGIELRFLEDSDALWERPDLEGGGLADTLSRLRDANLAVPCVDTSAFFHHPDPAVRRAANEHARRMMDLAARLGSPGIRVFGDRVQPGADVESTRRWIAEGIGALREHGRPLGVEVWLESHGDFASARDTLAILDDVPPDGVGVLWDPANAFERGEDPVDGARLLGPRIRHVHLKDCVRQQSGPAIPALMGQGEFPAGRALSILHALRYEGWVSFEWEKKWHPEIASPEVALPHFLAWMVEQERPPAAPSAGARAFDQAWLRVEIHEDRPGLGRAAARAVSAHVRRLVERDGRAAVIFASAPSQNEFLAALRADPEMPWRKIAAFHLDEYAGVDARHPASFRRFLADRLFDHVPVRVFHGLDGAAASPAAECARYSALLAEERPGLAILGIGENGHLAFIDPPTCDFEDSSDVRVVELDEACRRQQVSDGCFASLSDVPRAALSLTIPFLLRVPRAVAIVPGPAKAAAITVALEGPVSPACPASILRRHRDATLFLDEASAGGLGVLPRPRS